MGKFRYMGVKYAVDIINDELDKLYTQEQDFTDRYFNPTVAMRHSVVVGQIKSLERVRERISNEL